MCLRTLEFQIQINFEILEKSVKFGKVEVYVKENDERSNFFVLFTKIDSPKYQQIARSNISSCWLREDTHIFLVVGPLRV